MGHERGRYKPLEGELYLSETIAPPGLYGLVGTDIRILMQAAGCLPPAPDGRTACYEYLSAGAASRKREAKIDRRVEV